MKNLISLFNAEKFVSTIGIISVITTSAITGTAIAKKVGGDNLISNTSASEAIEIPTENQNQESDLSSQESDNTAGSLPNNSNAPVTKISPVPTPTSSLTFPAAPNAIVTANSPANNTTANTSNTMTLSELATHNGSNGNCYIAYNGIVYDVTNHPSWGGCSHHGTTGGRDITSIFPHPTSYLNGLPQVATLSGRTQTGSNGNNTGTSGTTVQNSHDDDDHDGDHEDHEEEQEDHEDHEVENH